MLPFHDRSVRVKFLKEHRQRRMTMRDGDMWRLFSTYVLPDRGILGVGCGALVMSAFSNAYAPKAMGRVIDAYAKRKESRGMLKRELGTTAAVFVLGALASGLRVRLFASLLERSLKRLRLDLYKAALARKIAVFESSSTADEESTADLLASSVDREARIFAATVTESSQNAVRFVSSTLNGAMSLARLNSRLAMELLCAVPVAALLLRKAMKAVAKLGSLAADAETACVTRGRDCLTRSMRFVRAAGAEKYEYDIFEGLASRSAASAVAHGAAKGLFHGLLDALAKIVV